MPASATFTVSPLCFPVRRFTLYVGMPVGVLKAGSKRSAKSIATSSCLATALCLTLLGACSTTRSMPQTPALQANLAQDCPALPAPPAPLIDPDRSIWELTMIAMYGDCAGRHRAAVGAKAN